MTPVAPGLAVIVVSTRTACTAWKHGPGCPDIAPAGSRMVVRLSMASGNMTGSDRWWPTCAPGGVAVGPAPARRVIATERTGRVWYWRLECGHRVRAVAQCVNGARCPACGERARK